MFTVIELQTTNGITSIISTVFQDRNQAEQKFHETLSYAAVSSVDIHAVSILTTDGTVIKNDVYYHNLNIVE
jgi:hypothetical protein